MHSGATGLLIFNDYDDGQHSYTLGINYQTTRFSNIKFDMQRVVVDKGSGQFAVINPENVNVLNFAYNVTF